MFPFYEIAIVANWHALLIPAILEAELWNGVGSIPVGGNSALIGVWIM